jgi:PKD domain
MKLLRVACLLTLAIASTGCFGLGNLFNTNSPTSPTTTTTPSLTATVSCAGATHGLVTACAVTAIDGSTNVTSAIASVVWTFGDGNTATIASSPSASNVYASAATYAVVAVVTTTVAEGGKTAVATTAVTIP